MHSSFTDIGQFREVIRGIKQAAQFVGIDENGEVIVNREADMPVVKFHGTVKIHGTNAGIAEDKDSNMWYQGRTQVVSIRKDNAGFAFFAESKKDIFHDFIQSIRKKTNIWDKTIVIFGEWCGGNIQKGVAICGLPKMFVIFAVKVVKDTNSYYLTRDVWSEYSSPDNHIFNINDFPSFDIDIDFSNPALVQNRLIEITEEVEKECPVAKCFGVSGIGEGVCWEGYYKDSRYIFKVKGEKHSVSKVKKLAEVDVEKINSIQEFVNYAVTENRLNQGIEQVFTSNGEIPNRSKTGDYLRWIVNDIAKEEMDTMISNNLEPKDVNKYISEKARKWFFAKLDEEISL